MAASAGRRKTFAQAAAAGRYGARRIRAAPARAGQTPAGKRLSVGPIDLLDTNAVSELRKPRPRGGVLASVRSLEEAVLRVAALTPGEIRAGIEVTREQDAATAEQIEDWLDLVAGAWNVLPVGAAVFRV